MSVNYVLKKKERKEILHVKVVEKKIHEVRKTGTTLRAFYIPERESATEELGSAKC